MNELRPNGQRSKVAIALIWLILALSVLLLVFMSLQYYLITIVEKGEYVSETVAYLADYGVSSVSMIYLIASITSIVTFIRWFRRAYYNIGMITHNMEYGDGWAAGAWFVPILNLFVPYKMMKELYTKTDTYLILKDGYIEDKKLKTDYIGWWWALWIISGIIGRIYLRLEWDSDDPISILSLIDSGLSILLCIITIIIIHDYSEAENLLYQLKEEGEGEGEDDDNKEEYQ